ncbi:ABC transporter permease [Magnetococcus sp. PR-3]|uniref:ABC transporter permease n=1 Tax=Magnetococcus sp. PR-3 TaxID=3120355 RepID=UPI002FCE2ABC
MCSATKPEDNEQAPGSKMQMVHNAWVIGRLHLHRRYCHSFLGAAWSWMHPVVYLLILWVVFSHLMPHFDNYFVYLAAGLLPWTFFRQGLTVSSTVLIQHRTIFYANPISFEVHVFGTLTAELLHFFSAFLILLLFMVIMGGSVGWHLLGIPLFLLNLILFTYACGLIVAFLTPIYRDINHLLQLFFTFGFWLMPIVYHWSSLSAPYQWLVKYNPLTLVISPFQILLHGGQWPTTKMMLISFGTVAATVWLAWHLATRTQLRQRIIYHL